MGLEVWTIDKNFFKRNKNYRFLYSLLVSKFGVEQANTIFDAANIELKRVTMEYPDIPKGERRHTNLFIFPRVAIYRVMKQHFGKDAIDLMDEVMGVSQSLCKPSNWCKIDLPVWRFILWQGKKIPHKKQPFGK